MPPAFSRVQLAAALIEYDNDPTDPDAPFRSARESAIFVGLRKAQEEAARAREVAEREEAERTAAAEAHDLSAVREEEEDDDVDLASWGLASLIPKEKGKDKDKQRTRKDSASNLGQGRPSSELGVAPRMSSELGMSVRAPSVLSYADAGRAPSALSHAPMPADDDGFRRRALGTRAVTLGAVDAPKPIDIRRNSYASGPYGAAASPLDIMARNLHAQGLVPDGDESVPFPAGHPSIDGPYAIPRAGRERVVSTASLGAASMLSAGADNPFAVPPPPPEFQSRFDPKAVHARTVSNATMGSRFLVEDSPFAVPPARPGSVLSRTPDDDPYGVPQGEPRNRRISGASLGSRMLLEPDELEEPPRRPPPQHRGSSSWRYSKMDLMRPKVLVMPTPLQGSEDTGAPDEAQRDGFLLSTDGPPLPPGARTRPSATRYSSSSSAALNPLIPNPRASLTLAQLTFRNNLLIDGKRDVAYVDIDEAVPRAAEEGEQVDLHVPEEPDEFEVVGQPDPLRPAGKLYGKSLIDDLENRKAKMKGKARVFTGDQRPSMMHKRNTLIDPESLQLRPQQQRADSDPNLARRPTIGGRRISAPLLDFGENPGGLPQTRSVFGVDKVWERELAKLKEIEEMEKKENEERERREAERNTRKHKGKGKAKETPSPAPEEPKPRAASPPPMLPAVPSTRGRPPLPTASDSESDDDDDLQLASRNARQARESHHTLATIGANGWFASSDEEDGPRRPRQVNAMQSPSRGAVPARRAARPAEDDSDSDVPLAAQIDKVMQRARSGGAVSDSDSDRPLAQVLEKTRLTLPPLALGDSVSSGLVNERGDTSDDDDVPLALRKAHSQSQIGGSQSRLAAANDDDDDQPLAFRRSQYPPQAPFFAPPPPMHIMTPQAMLMQSMYAPSMMSGFAPPMAVLMPQMQMPPLQMPAPQADASNLSRVDRWRHDVSTSANVS